PAARAGKRPALRSNRRPARRAETDRAAAERGWSAGGTARSTWPSAAGWPAVSYRRISADSTPVSELALLPSWILPFLLRLSVDAILHRHLGMIVESVGLLVLPHDIHHVLNRAVIHALPRPTVAAANLRRGQLPAGDGDIEAVFALNIVRRPAEITGRHKPGVTDHHQLKKKDR